MAAIGMLLLWASYTMILYGVCLMRGYQITLLDLVVPGRWKGGWPPQLTSDASSSSGGGSSSGGSSGNGSSSGSGSSGGSTKLPLPTGPFGSGGGGGGVLEA